MRTDLTVERLEILSEAGKRGGKAKKHCWTLDEIDIVRREYKGTNESAAWIANYLSHLVGERITLCAVKGQVQKLGLGSRRPPRWTPEEEERLAELITQYAPITVAKMMHRGLNSIVLKAKRMGLSRRCHDGWYTKREVCEICGVDHKKVQQWLDSGKLRGQAHFPGDTPQKNGQHPWHILEKDLRDFIVSYNGELQGRNVDLMQIVNILVGI